MRALGLALVFLGYMLVWAAVKDEAPWEEVVHAFGGSTSAPPTA